MTIFLARADRPPERGEHHTKNELRDPITQNKDHIHHTSSLLTPTQTTKTTTNTYAIAHRMAAQIVATL